MAIIKAGQVWTGKEWVQKESSPNVVVINRGNGIVETHTHSNGTETVSTSTPETRAAQASLSAETSKPVILTPESNVSAPFAPTPQGKIAEQQYLAKQQVAKAKVEPGLAMIQQGNIAAQAAQQIRTVKEPGVIQPQKTYYGTITTGSPLTPETRQIIDSPKGVYVEVEPNTNIFISKKDFDKTQKLSVEKFDFDYYSPSGEKLNATQKENARIKVENENFRGASLMLVSGISGPVQFGAETGTKIVLSESEKIAAQALKEKLGGTFASIGSTTLTKSEQVLMEKAIAAETQTATPFFSKVLTTFQTQGAKQAGQEVLGGVSNVLTGLATKETAKQVVVKGAILGASEIGYTLAPKAPTAARLYSMSGNIEYKNPDEEVKSAVSKGYALANQTLFGGKENVVDESGNIVKTNYVAASVQLNPLESYLKSNIPYTKTLGFGEGFFGAFPESNKKIYEESIISKLKETKAYKESSNKDVWLKEAINTEFYAAQTGGLVGQTMYETSSELGLSTVAGPAIKGLGSVIGYRAGLPIALGLTTPIFGWQEGGKTIETVATTERQNLSLGQIQGAQVQGAISATAFNVLRGIGFPSKNEPNILPNQKGLGKGLYYGATGVAYAMDPFEFLVDTAIDKSNLKGIAGINVTVPSTIFTTTQTQSNTPSGGTGKGNALTDSILQNNTNVDIPSETKTNTGTQTQTNTGTTTNINTTTNTSTNTQNNVLNEINTNTTTSTTTNTNVNIPSIVSPNGFPGIPLFGLPSEGVAGRSSSQRKKYVSEAALTLAAYKEFTGGFGFPAKMKFVDVYKKAKTKFKKSHFSKASLLMAKQNKIKAPNFKNFTPNLMGFGKQKQNKVKGYSSPLTQRMVY